MLNAAAPLAFNGQSNGVRVLNENGDYSSAGTTVPFDNYDKTEHERMPTTGSNHP